ncbi:hypothetical protein FBU30_007981, partial [Linnemannia zychae]
MSILAHSTLSTTATAAALGRFHTANKGDSFGRQRSSSFSRSSPYLQTGTGTGASVRMSSLTNLDSLGEGSGPHRDLSASSSSPAMSTSSYSASQSASESPSSSLPSSIKAHHQFGGDNLDRNNFAQATNNANGGNSINSTTSQAWLTPSTIDINNNIQEDQAQENTPKICTGRSRSNTLTNTGTAPAEVAAAAISTQFDHVMRPRRPSLVSRPSGSGNYISLVFSQQDNNSTSKVVNATVQSRHPYPPTPILPQFNEITTSNDSDRGLDASEEISTAPLTRFQLGFLARILVLIGIFGMSLGGLYLIAQVLPPLSLPKSIDDVKVDAAILQEFATATYEGWIRTFWVFSVVYMWKQCFGIPGSAFL